MEDLVKNNLGLEVLTDAGWSKFDGILLKGQRTVAELKLSNTSIDATLDHNVFTTSYSKIQIKNLRPGQEIFTKNGIQRVVSVKLKDIVPVFDLLNVEQNHRFYANDILCSNCEFIINDETLINPVHLVEMSGIDPIEKQGQVRWYKKPESGKTYVVGLDPSLGTGGDYSAIQVFELPGLKQVAEWTHNKTIVQRQVVIMREICAYLAEIAGPTSVYYSVENNTLGEAALVSISEIGEENFRGVFLSEPRKMGGGGTRFRKGFNTTNKSKLAACAKLKSLVETKRMTIASKLLISELKNFVASGQSYAAKLGEHDDLVMSTLLTVRMMQLIQNYDSQMDEELRDNVDIFIEPMPFIASF